MWYIPWRISDQNFVPTRARAVFLISLNAATYPLILCREKCLVNSWIESPSLYLGILFNSNVRFAGNLDLREFRVS